MSTHLVSLRKCLNIEVGIFCYKKKSVLWKAVPMVMFFSFFFSFFYYYFFKFFLIVVDFVIH